MALVLKVDKKKHMFAMLDRLDKMRNDKSRSNFKVRVRENIILAQRDILIAASDYFDAMLSHDTKENQCGEVEMMDVDFECVKICIDFIYGREISVPPEKYEDLMFVAHMMQLKILCVGIEELMAENMNLKSFFKLKKISDLYECPLLRQKCKKFAEKNFLAMSKEKDFKEVDKQYLLSLIESDNIKISELEKLEILLEWIKHKSSRTSDLANLLKGVDLDKIPIGHRRYFIENEQLISEDLECFRKFSISIMNSNKIPALNPNEQQILIFDDDFENLRVFNQRINQVTETKLQKCGVQGDYSVIMLENHVYVMCEDKSVYCLKYSEDKSAWKRKADMIEEHGQIPPVVIVSGDIYVIGGGGGMKSSAVEKYDPSKNEWSKFCQKMTPSNGSEVVALERCIYSLGGHIEDQITNEVEKLDVTKSEWIRLAPMNEQREFAAATKWKGNIIVAGGYSNSYETLHSVEYYNIAMDQWMMLPSMNLKRSYFKLVYVDGQIFAPGGGSGDAQSSIEKFDEENSKWVIVELAGGTKLKINSVILVDVHN